MTTSGTDPFDLLAGQILRNWMVDSDAEEILEYASDLGVNRREVTEMALKQELCPIHFADFAGCFDDLDPECEQVRVIYSTH